MGIAEAEGEDVGMGLIDGAADFFPPLPKVFPFPPLPLLLVGIAEAVGIVEADGEDVGIGLIEGAADFFPLPEFPFPPLPFPKLHFVPSGLTPYFSRERETGSTSCDSA